MVKAWIDRIENKIKIQTDDPSVRYFLEVTKKVTEYIPYQKRWMTITKTYKIYDSKKTVQGLCTYTLGKGWAGYVANTFSPYISGDEYNDILSSILSETYRDTPFPELRDYQNEDVLHMLKYKIGLCGVYTSYGNKKKYLFMKRLIDVELLRSLIMSGKKSKELCKILNLNRNTLFKYLKQFNLSFRDYSYFDINILNKIDTEEKAYWLGFLYADGYVCGYNNQVEVSLAEIDRGHLIKLKNFLLDSRNISCIKTSKVKNQYTRCRYTIGNKYFHDRLISLGCFPRKSLSLVFPDESIFSTKELIKDFIRGYIDGDGCLYANHSRLAIEINGTESFLNSIRNYFPEFSIPKKR